MSESKSRFSARVKDETLESLDAHAEAAGKNRSEMIETIVEEWEGGVASSPHGMIALGDRLLLSGVGLALSAILVQLGMLELPLSWGPATATAVAVVGVLAIAANVSAFLSYAATVVVAETDEHAGVVWRRRLQRLGGRPA